MIKLLSDLLTSVVKVMNSSTDNTINDCKTTECKKKKSLHDIHFSDFSSTYNSLNGTSETKTLDAGKIISAIINGNKKK